MLARVRLLQLEKKFMWEVSLYIYFKLMVSLMCFNGVRHSWYFCTFWVWKQCWTFSKLVCIYPHSQEICLHVFFCLFSFLRQNTPGKVPANFDFRNCSHSNIFVLHQNFSFPLCFCPHCWQFSSISFNKNLIVRFVDCFRVTVCENCVFESE